MEAHLPALRRMKQGHYSKSQTCLGYTVSSVQVGVHRKNWSPSAPRQDTKNNEIVWMSKLLTDRE